MWWRFWELEAFVPQQKLSELGTAAVTWCSCGTYRLEMLLTGQKLKGCKWLEGGFQPRKPAVFTHASSWISVNIVSSVPFFLWRNAVSCFVAWSRLLLNAVSLMLMMFRQVHQQGCGISNCSWILRKRSSWRAETHSISSELRNRRCVSYFCHPHVRPCICLCSHQSSFGN